MLAIIVSRRDFREYDLLISAFTKERGKVELLAKGAKKITSKNQGLLQPFFIVDVEWVAGRELNHLTKVVPEHSLNNIPKYLTALQLLGRTFKLFDQVVALGEKDERLFSLLYGWLHFLNEEENIVPEVISSFFLQLWQALGYTPELSGCVRCGQKVTIVFSPASGGFFCSSCLKIASLHAEKIIPLSRVDQIFFQKLATATFASANMAFRQNQHPQVAESIRAFVEFHSHRRALVGEKKVR